MLVKDTKTKDTYVVIPNKINGRDIDVTERYQLKKSINNELFTNIFALFFVPCMNIITLETKLLNLFDDKFELAKQWSKEEFAAFNIKLQMSGIKVDVWDCYHKIADDAIDLRTLKAGEQVVLYNKGQYLLNSYMPTEFRLDTLTERLYIVLEKIDEENYYVKVLLSPLYEMCPSCYHCLNTKKINLNSKKDSELERTFIFVLKNHFIWARKITPWIVPFTYEVKTHTQVLPFVKSYIKQYGVYIDTLLGNEVEPDKDAKILGISETFEIDANNLLFHFVALKKASEETIRKAIRFIMVNSVSKNLWRGLHVTIKSNYGKKDFQGLLPEEYAELLTDGILKEIKKRIGTTGKRYSLCKFLKEKKITPGLWVKEDSGKYLIQECLVEPDEEFKYFYQFTKTVYSSLDELIDESYKAMNETDVTDLVREHFRDARLRL